MGELIPIGIRGSSGVVNDRLGQVLFNIRESLGTERNSQEVVTQPLAEGFDPFVRPDGSMQLGEIGINEFIERFGRLNVNPLYLYVRYYGWRSEMEAARKTDPTFHDDLLDIAAEAEKRRLFPGAKGLHEVEGQLIGSFAADLSMQGILNHPKLTIRRSEVVQAAQRPRRIQEEPEYQDQLSRALGHFKLTSVPEISDRIAVSLKDAASRQKSAVEYTEEATIDAEEGTDEATKNKTSLRTL